MKFSERLAYLLDEHNLKQIDLAIALNIAPSTLNGYLRRDREPNYETLANIAKFFEVSTDYLLGLTENRRPHFKSESYDDKEEDLLQTYRTLGPKEQTYLIHQAHTYQEQNLDYLGPKKKSLITHKINKTPNNKKTPKSSKTSPKDDKAAKNEDS